MGAPFDHSVFPPDDRPIWQQPRVLVGLCAVAALVLVAGVFVAMRGGGDSIATDDTLVRPSSPTAPPTLAPTTSTIAPTTTAGSTTTTSSSTTTTTTTTTTSPPPPAAADAGDDLVVSFGETVTLTAYDLSSADQSVVWRQVGGPDVTSGLERFVGNSATFTAPSGPASLFFEVDVTGRAGDVATDDLRVDVFEEAAAAFFVDGERGDDGGDGSRVTPFRSFGRAIQATDGNTADIYLRAIDGFVYELAERRSIGGGSSVYGGFDAEWVYHRETRTQVMPWTHSRFTAAVISTVDVVPAPHIGALRVTAGTSIVIDNVSVTGAEAAADHNRAMSIDDVTEVLIDSSTLRATAAASGADGIAPGAGPAPGIGGNDASGPSGGAGGHAGGDGGQGPVAGNDGAGTSGGDGGEPGAAGSPGGSGPGGTGGVGGDGGQGLAAPAALDPSGARGLDGATGTGGSAGGGGGGGGGVALLDGGGGGGGGTGGGGGAGGGGAAGGFGSLGLEVRNVGSLMIRNSFVVGGVAGDGGHGAPGRAGAGGGRGGDGAAGGSTADDAAGSGAGGGGAGAGGAGGQGGGGAGGRSVGLLTQGVDTVVIEGSTIRGGQGGDGGVGGRAGDGGGAGQSGDGDAGGTGGVFPGPAPAPERHGLPASGGDSYGWWDDGTSIRTITGSTVEAGQPGQPGGDGGLAGQAWATSF